MNYYWVLEIMKTTKLRNIRDFFTAVKPFVRLFRPFFTDRNDRNGSGKSISHHHLLACSAWGLNRIRRIRSLWHLSGVLSRYFWLISGTRGWDLSRAGNLKALLDNVIVSRMSTLLPGTLSLNLSLSDLSLCECSAAKTHWAQLVTRTLHQNPTNSVTTSICTHNSGFLRVIEC